ncbi:MAG: metal-dependent hydrolase [Candidatus Bruticola sp.]
MKLHYFGHSAFALEYNEHQAVIIDPFISGNPHMKGKNLPSGLTFSHILLTHGHGDHSGDAESLAKLHGAEVVAPFELASILGGKGISAFPCALGGKLTFPWGWMRLVPATHSSSYEGKFAGPAVGLIINIDGLTVYHSGDTGLFGDMELIGRRYNPDLALLPIGGTFTMDIEEALEAVKMIKPKTAVPMHFNTFPVVQADPQNFKQLVEAETETKVIVMAAGEVREFGK